MAGSVAFVPLGGGGGAPGESNTVTNLRPAVALAQRFTIDGTEVGAAAAVAQGPIAVRAATHGPAVSLVERTEGTPRVTQVPAVALSQRFAVATGVPVLPAASLVSVTYALNRRVGANVVDNIGAFAWSNPTNAQGIHDATNATMAGDVLAAREGTLRFAYANLVNSHTELAISQVNLHYYVAAAGTVLNNGELRLAYRVDGTTTYAGSTLLETITGDVASLSTPRTFDITAAVGGDWSKIDALVGFVRGLTDAAEPLVNYSAAAVELEVVASVTDAL